MKKLFATLLALTLLLTMIPLGAVSVSAAQYTLYWPVPTSAAAIGRHSSAFGPRTAPTSGASTNHRGIDIPVVSGTPVYSAYDGEIVVVGRSNARGNYVVVYHTSIGLSTLYQHLTCATVQKGDTVSGGTQIAVSGNTGIGTGAHLHYGVMKGKATKADNDQPSWDMAINPLGSNITYRASSGIPTPVETYDTVSTGTYYIKNNGTGKYLDVANGLDEQLQNIQVTNYNGSNAQKYEIKPSTTTTGYSMCPLCSGSRMVNVQASTVVSGKNVCLYNNTGNASQRWYFEKVSGGYVIRSVQTPSCVLDVQSGGNVYVSTYTGASSQIWTLQDATHTHTYTNACDTTCNTCGATRSTTHTYTGANDATCNVCGATRTMCTVSFDVNGGQGNITPLSVAPGEKVTIWVNSPKRSGHIFVGWSEAIDGSGYIYPYGSTYSVTKNVTLYAAWKKDTTKTAYDADGNVYYRSYVIDGINKGRGTAKTILYNRSYGSATGTNEYGVEATVDATGKVLYHVYGVGNATIPKDGFVLSAHIYEDNLFVLNHISVGDYVYFDSAVNTIYVFSTKAKMDAFLNCKDGHLGRQVVKNKITATCEEEGYTGDICCSECKEVTKAGTVIAKGEHIWESGSCSVCGMQSPTKVVITGQSKTTYTKMGDVARAMFTASGEDKKCQWYIKNAGQTKYYKSSVTSPIYRATMSDEVKDRSVYCVVTDKYGNTARTETIRLREAVSITKESATADYAQMGKKASAKVTASGDGLTYTWYIKNEGQTRYSKSSVTKATYTTTMSAKAKNRRLYCVVKDKYGNKVFSKTFILRESVSIVTQPKSVKVAKNAKATVTVKASGDGLKYVWYIKDVGDAKYTKSSITTSSYTTKMNAIRNGRKLICYVYDKYGNKVQAKTVVIKMK